MGDGTAYDITAEQAEKLLDQAGRKITRYGKRYDIEVPEMTGTAGSKTLDLDKAVAGAVLDVAVAIYKRDFKQSGAQSQSSTLGPASASSSVNSSPDDLAKEAVMNLREIEVTYG